MNDIKTLTDRIIERADKQLEKRIEESCKAFDNECRDGCAWQVTFESKEMSWYQALFVIRKTLFERKQQSNRQAALDEFMSRVEGLQNELDNLRSEL